jgi:hypothetical protein
VSMSRGCVWGQEPGGGGMSVTGSLAGVMTLCWRLFIISRGLGGASGATRPGIFSGLGADVPMWACGPI